MVRQRIRNLTKYALFVLNVPFYVVFHVFAVRCATLKTAICSALAILQGISVDSLITDNFAFA